MINSIHDVRFFNFAIIDIIGTILISYIVYRYTRTKIPFINLTILFFILGVFIHYIFNIDTMVNYLLGLSNKPKRYRNNPRIFDIITE